MTSERTLQPPKAANLTGLRRIGANFNEHTIGYVYYLLECKCYSLSNSTHIWHFLPHRKLRYTRTLCHICQFACQRTRQLAKNAPRFLCARSFTGSSPRDGPITKKLPLLGALSINGAGERTWTFMGLPPYGPEPYASANSAIPAFFQPACFALFAPLVDCSLIITQELDNVNRKIQKN